MEKTVTLNLRVNPTVKREVENLVVTWQKSPRSINADLMTDDVLYTKVLQGIEDADEGRTQNAKESFHKFREDNF